MRWGPRGRRTRRRKRRRNSAALESRGGEGVYCLEEKREGPWNFHAGARWALCVCSTRGRGRNTGVDCCYLEKDLFFVGNSWNLGYVNVYLLFIGARVCYTVKKFICKFFFVFYVYSKPDFSSVTGCPRVQTD